MILGYCCINTSLRESKPSVYTGRSLIRRTFSLEKASELAYANVKDLLSILKWNSKNNIKNFRITSELFPRITDTTCAYKVEDLKDAEFIIRKLKEIGEFAKNNNQVLSLHPGPFTCLASDNPEVVKNSIVEVESHAWLARTIGVPININFHVGRKFSPQAAELFIETWKNLPGSTTSIISLENDDKESGWSVRKLFDYIYPYTGIPIVQDIHHSEFSREKDISLEEEFNIAESTWSSREWQEVHYSESADENKMIPAHSDYVYKPLPAYLLTKPKVYVELECKAKEKALLLYRSKYGE